MALNIKPSVKKKTLNCIISLFRYLVLIGLCFIILYPLFAKISIVFMEKQDLYDTTVHYLPKHFTIENIRFALNLVNYIPTLLKTVALIAALSLLQVVSSMLVGYGFARFKFPLKRFWFACVLLTLIVPPTTCSIPLYLYFQNFNLFGLLGERGISLIGSPLLLFLMSSTAVGLRNGLFIYMFRQHFLSFPNELEEAGQIDGAGSIQIFTRIIVPCAVSMFVTCFLFCFVWQWTDTYYASVFLPDNKLMQTQIQGLAQTATSQLTLMTGENDSYFASIMNNAGILLLILPLLVMYGFLQKFFIESIERAGIVG